MPRAPAVFHVFCPCLPIHTTHGVQGREGAWRPLEEAAPLSLHPSCGAFLPLTVLTCSARLPRDVS